MLVEILKIPLYDLGNTWVQIGNQQEFKLRGLSCKKKYQNWKEGYQKLNILHEIVEGHYLTFHPKSCANVKVYHGKKK